MKTIKSIIKSVLVLGICIGIICVTGESDDLTTQAMWTLGWMAELAGCSRGLTKLLPDEFKEEV